MITVLFHATAKEKYRFIIGQLARLHLALGVPEMVVIQSGVKVGGLEALALVFRRSPEPSKLNAVANEFGRSRTATFRIFWYTINLKY